MAKLTAVLGGFGLGLVAMYFFDPEAGPERRSHLLRLASAPPDRTLAPAVGPPMPQPTLKTQTWARQTSENDVGSPGMIGAASSSDVAHASRSDGLVKSAGLKRPPSAVELMPPDIGGGG